jgi:hypothetical protein
MPDEHDVPPVLVVKWLTEPPPVSPVNKIPQLIDLQPAAPEDDDDPYSPATHSEQRE